LVNPSASRVAITASSYPIRAIIGADFLKLTKARLCTFGKRVDRIQAIYKSISCPVLVHSLSRNAELIGHPDQFRKRPCAHLSHDVTAADLNGDLTHAKLSRDLLV
jgi:hypothetical protein